MNTMKVHLVVLCVMSLIALTMQFAYTCDKNPHVNGCSVPFGIKTAFKGRYKPACNKHDICYYCMKRFGLSRLQCDKRFRRNMKSICKSIKVKNIFKRLIKRRSCKLHADAYYEGVRTGGGPYVAKRTPRWCRSKWVVPCMK